MVPVQIAGQTGSSTEQTRTGEAGRVASLAIVKTHIGEIYGIASTDTISRIIKSSVHGGLASSTNIVS